jgi:phosphohistidine swiveling domain-containing protein
MADDRLAELLRTQKSLTEWLEDIKHSDAAVIRQEDNDKRERLKVLNEVISLPFDRPTQFEASEMRDDNPRFMSFFEGHGNELCALRLMPKEEGLPKLRMRGKTIKGAYAWFVEQAVDTSKYRADFMPHAEDSAWATIFIVNKHGVQGEIIYGGHHQLTQGFHDAAAPMVFRYDFKTWVVEPVNEDALAHLKKLAELLYVPSKAKRDELAEKLGSTFVNGYLAGYFETTDSAMGTWYIDYSPTLGKMYADAVMRTNIDSSNALVSGQTGSPGKSEGPVCIVAPDNLSVDFPVGGVLVCPVTTPDYVPLMQKAAAIVTDQGGILSHAAIVARELHKPCIVGTGNATAVLKNGQNVMVDADAGTVAC